jgi:epoxyqueuosine reductase
LFSLQCSGLSVRLTWHEDISSLLCENVSMQSPLLEFVHGAASLAGFERAGVAPANHHGMRELDRFAEWIEAGYAGEMQYLKTRTESGEYKRSSLQHALPWANSVIVAAMNYNSAAPRSTEAADATQGWISRYALSPRDYHDTVLGSLKRLEQDFQNRVRQSGREVMTRSYVDTGPVLERVYAKYAGIGWPAKNTCIINQELGSWIFLGVIVTSIEYSEFFPEGKLEIAPDRCGSCTRCIDACPTQAIIAPRQLDASRCIAYFTIEKRGSVPEPMREKIGRHVFGCDICQDVCPWNRGIEKRRAGEPLPDDATPHVSLVDWLQSDPDALRRRFARLYVPRNDGRRLRLNALVAAGNVGGDGERDAVAAYLDDPDETIRELAGWALARLEERDV